MTETELASQPAGTQPVVPAWRFFPAEVARLCRLSPSFLRVTFTGADLADFADNGYDQRIKLVLPDLEHGFTHLPDGPDWYARWRSLPERHRNPFRTYTVRAARPHLREVDVDVVLHGDGGPAARWAGAARVGDQLMIMGPDRRYPADHGGREFQPPPEADTLLLAGDETAVPAICAVLERLPGGSRGEVLLEVPHPDDVLPLSAPPLVTVTWLARSGAPHGSRLVPALRAVAGRLFRETAAGRTTAGPSDPDHTTAGPPDPEHTTARRLDAPPDAGTGAPDPDGGTAETDAEVLWEVPAGAPAGRIYGWLAGEAGVVRALRRHLVAERGLDRAALAFMGYWRLGRADED